jgi:anti-sigma B factor antagonist
MDVSIETLEGVTVIRLNGALDARSVNGFRDQLSALIAAGAVRFVVDAAQLRFVDSMGLGALLYLRRFARQGVDRWPVTAQGKVDRSRLTWIAEMGGETEPKRVAVTFFREKR